MKRNSTDANFFRCLLSALILFNYATDISGQKVNENEVVDDSKVGEKVEPIHYRLPNNTKPESYDITLITNIDLNEFNFTGRVAIKLRALEASNNITIHARELNISRVDLTTASGTAIQLSPFTYDNVTEFLVIPTKTGLIKDAQYVLTVAYAGELKLTCEGFYRSWYTDSKGEKMKV